MHVCRYAALLLAMFGCALVPTPARAQLAAPDPPPPQPSTCNAPGGLTAEALLDSTVNARRQTPPRLALQLGATADNRLSGVPETIQMHLQRGQTAIGPWMGVDFIGAARARPRGKEAEELHPQGVYVSVLKRSEQGVDLQVELPHSDHSLIGHRWELIVAACLPDGDRLAGFGMISVRVRPIWLAIGGASVLALFGWLLAAVVVWKLNAERLQAAWLAKVTAGAEREAERAKPTFRPFRRGAWPPQPDVQARLRFKLIRALYPVYIAQDSTGYGSLSRLQLLMFSVAVAGAVTYVYLRVGSLPDFSDGVLYLLGISGASTTLARLSTDGPKLSAAGRRLLTNHAVFRRDPAILPRLTDLVSGQGEIDITRVQALLFSMVVLVALLWSGTQDLANFQVPNSLITLLGISQGIYLFGKALPTESATRLNADIEALLAAARAAARAEPDSLEYQAFVNARSAVRTTLADIYDGAVWEGALESLTPQQVV